MLNVRICPNGTLCGGQAGNHIVLVVRTIDIVSKSKCIYSNLVRLLGRMIHCWCDVLVPQSDLSVLWAETPDI